MLPLSSENSPSIRSISIPPDTNHGAEMNLEGFYPRMPQNPHAPYFDIPGSERWLDLAQSFPPAYQIDVFPQGHYQHHPNAVPLHFTNPANPSQTYPFDRALVLDPQASYLSDGVLVPSTYEFEQFETHPAVLCHEICHWRMTRASAGADASRWNC